MNVYSYNIHKVISLVDGGRWKLTFTVRIDRLQNGENILGDDGKPL